MLYITMYNICGPRSALACLAGGPLPSGGDGMAARAGRPKRGKEENRTAQVNVRLTVAEQEELRQEADSAGLSIGDYVRRRVMGRPVTAQVERRTINELRRLGGLLKLAHLESKGAYSADSRKAILEIQAAIARIGAPTNDRQESP